MSSNARIAKNTLALYIRVFLSMIVSLYTARIILNTLGIEDYGINNVVNGIVMMFNIINSAMVTSTQRFLTFELGKGDIPQLKKVFSMSLNIHILIAIIIFILAETVGLWFLNYKLVIPIERINAANWVYQFSIIAAMISITQVPYSAAITAHENFKVYAYVGLAEVFLRLVIVFLLVYISFDKLKLYAFLGLCVSIGIALYYRFYCKKEFQECTYHFDNDKKLFKTLISFSGWSFLGSSSNMMLMQGMNILINLFFGVRVNAARGITVQVGSTIDNFIGNFTSAMNPQITKNYANNKLTEMNILMQRGAKFSFFLLFLLSLPVFIETEKILKIWLDVVPPYTVGFIRLNLIISLIYSLTHTYYTGIFATGNIKKYQVFISISITVLFTLTYVLLKMGFPPESIYFIHIIVALFELTFRISAVKRTIGFPIRTYLENVLLKVFIVILITIPVPLLIYFYLDPTIFRLFLIIGTSSVISVFSVFYAGLTKSERVTIIYLLTLQYEKMIKLKKN